MFDPLALFVRRIPHQATSEARALHGHISFPRKKNARHSAGIHLLVCPRVEVCTHVSHGEQKQYRVPAANVKRTPIEQSEKCHIRRSDEYFRSGHPSGGGWGSGFSEALHLERPGFCRTFAAPPHL